MRFDGETDSAFRQRAERTLRIAKVLVEACLANECTRAYIADPSLPMYTIESVRRDPIVRVEYEQAIAVGEMGTCLAATKSKRWGEGPSVMPLEPADWYFPDRVTYQYRECSLYNRRYEQRMRMKELLGKRWRKLVGEAKWHTKKIFLGHLTASEAAAIRRILSIDAGTFWQAAKGTRFLELPKRAEQLELNFNDP